ncbi:MAG: [protein-PII] uridylyltransferase [Halocynthiibacter sp.]
MFICNKTEIFDRTAHLAAKPAKCTDPSYADDLRSWVGSSLREQHANGLKAIQTAFLKSPYQARETSHAISYLTDCVVQEAFKVAREIVTLEHPNLKKTPMTLLAVGGYGRAEMAPQSDVDLLLLTTENTSEGTQSRTQEIATALLYILWDLRLKVGHAVRTVKDCIDLGAEDYTIRTALLENRYLRGDKRLYETLNDHLWEDLFKGSEQDFIEAKLEERDLRHEKQGGQRYVVEPNIKEGKGGLRDLQSLYWIAKYIYSVQDISELVPLGLITPEEVADFNTAHNFLWATRCHLHWLAKRPVEKLSFDMQVEVASLMQYEDHDGRRAVEYFMQDYFRHATRVGDLTRIFLTALEANHVKRAPSIIGFFKRKKRVKSMYKIQHNRLAIKDNDAFLLDKMNILRLFEEALRSGYLIHPDAMRLVSANLDLIDDEMRKSKEANRVFFDTLLKHGNPERALRRMNELGILAAFIPEFEPIVAMMQFNMYHHYTVDEHTIQCISNLAQIERGELIEELPIASSILEKGINRKVLYLALMLHDIGKGREEAHEILGARIARKVGPRMGLKDKESETVEWLVRMHLLMSDVAQKRDISDPRTVMGFAKAVRSVRRLDLLTVLTVCDIRGVGPETWNNWKAMLIRDLYKQTRTALENGIEAISTAKRATEAKSSLRTQIEDWDPKVIKKELNRHYPAYWQGLQADAHLVFAKLLRDVSVDEISIDLTPNLDRDATQACFAIADHPGIFSRLSGAIALSGANVVDARTYTTKDGYATAVFWLQDADGHPYEGQHIEKLKRNIKRILKGEVIARDALKSRDKLKKRERAFRVPTSINFDNEGSEIYTMIEVDTRDRPGLLSDLTKALANANIRIFSAVIATYGEQVVDTFYVKDMIGSKLHSQDKRDDLEATLRVAIAEGAKRAEGA